MSYRDAITNPCMIFGRINDATILNIGVFTNKNATSHGLCVLSRKSFAIQFPFLDSFCSKTLGMITVISSQYCLVKDRGVRTDVDRSNQGGTGSQKGHVRRNNGLSLSQQWHLMTMTQQMVFVFGGVIANILLSDGQLMAFNA
jgi:hypothetical protein